MPHHDPSEFAERLLGSLTFLGTCVKVLKVLVKWLAEYVEDARERRAKALPEPEDRAELRRRLEDVTATAVELRAENARLCLAVKASDERADKADARAARLQGWIDARTPGAPPPDAP